MLRRISEVAIEHQALGGGLLINYDGLPGAVEARILPHFGIDPDGGARLALRAAGGRNAKAPAQAFSSDTDGKRKEATPTLHAAVAEHLAGPYRRLEELRLAQG